MAWSYGGDPTTSDRDWVRFRIGDTVETDQLITDGEIASMLAQEPTKQKAALLVAKALLAKWAREVNSKMGKLTLDLGQRIDALKSVIEDLRREADTAAGALGSPWMAAHRIDRREAIQEDTNRLQPAFAVGMNDFERQSAQESNRREDDANLS